MFGCTRLPARISDLKKRGIEIDSKWLRFNHSITGKKGSFKNYFLKRELPFACEIYDKEPVEVHNHLSGKSCMLEPDAIAVFDCIKGAEITKEYDMARKGLAWFRKHFPKEYMILLD